MWVAELTRKRRAEEVALQEQLIKQSAHMAKSALEEARTLRLAANDPPSAAEAAARELMAAAEKLGTRQGQPVGRTDFPISPFHRLSAKLLREMIGMHVNAACAGYVYAPSCNLARVHVSPYH